MSMTKRAVAREELIAHPPVLSVGERVNVDGIGMSLTIIAINLGARDWAIDVRMDDGRTWVVTPDRCWTEA